VRDPHPVPTTCRYCSGQVSIVNHVDIYGGRTFGEWPWMYVCDVCGARVGMHPFTNIPTGTLADEALREARKVCKPSFERLWQEGGWQRDVAYAWLADKLGMTTSECHWGLFEIDTCRRARDLCAGMMGAIKA
jgi:hypothetical protein